MSDSVTATPEILHQNLFGPQPYAHVVIGYHISEDGTEIPAGFALYFFNFSTFLGKPGLYLEDLFVKDEFRGKGYGKRLLQYLATIAKARDCGRFEWTVLDWNEPSINFYKSLGAAPMDEWDYLPRGGRRVGQASRAVLKCYLFIENCQTFEYDSPNDN